MLRWVCIIFVVLIGVWKKSRVVYCFWTGRNSMSSNRRQCYDSIRHNVGVPVILVTPKNLSKFIKTRHPLHPAYDYLSEVHKADYLRTYFMHHYGGGYTDIKMTTMNWNAYFDSLENSDKLANGYTEIENGSASPNEAIREQWKELIGNGAYIFKPQTIITRQWINALHQKLDRKLEALRNHPAHGPRDCTGSTEYTESPSKYPLRWAELLGEHFHDIIYPHRDKLLHDLPPINTISYK